MSMQAKLSFGIKTAPQNTTYEDVLRVWREADEISSIEHAWLWDHFLPLGIEPDRPILEGWTLLAALAAQTDRLGLGLMVTGNPNRYPAVLAKMAATVDVISQGRLVLGIGAGVSGPEPEAYGVPVLPPSERLGRLDEACEIVRRMWTDSVVDFAGRYYHLQQARCEPKPVQKPHPPFLIGGGGEQRTLRVVARHADLWNLPIAPGGSTADFRSKSRILDDHCAAIGRHPGAITRSVQLFIDQDADPRATRAYIREFVVSGATHVVLNLLPPYPPGLARWIADEIVEPIAADVNLVSRSSLMELPDTAVGS